MVLVQDSITNWKEKIIEPSAKFNGIKLYYNKTTKITTNTK